MSMEEICNRAVVVTQRAAPLGGAVHLPCEHYVGSLTIGVDLLEIVPEQLNKLVRLIESSAEQPPTHAASILNMEFGRWKSEWDR
jgi:hypothetical protein